MENIDRQMAELIELTTEIGQDLCDERDTLREKLAIAVDLLKRFTHHELPEIETATDTESIVCVGHMDHEHYRKSVRLAKEFLANEVGAE